VFVEPPPDGEPQVLWAMELDERLNPVYAHRIVDPPVCPPRGRWPERLTAACGRVFTSEHDRGWWSTRNGELPLQAHAVHCAEPNRQKSQPSG
jgi:hypothetical protein